MTAGPLVDPGTAPSWLAGLVAGSDLLHAEDFARASLPGSGAGRPAAVLALFGQDAATGAPDLVLVRRSDELSAHSGQVALPGGAVDAGDDGAVAAAVREAGEEVGVAPEDVRPLALLPELSLPVSGFAVTPVIAHWQRPGPVGVVDPGETAAVARAPVPVLADPANRLRVRGPSGHTHPAFTLPGMLVWGFTGGLVNVLLELGGWQQPWDTARVADLDAAWRIADSLGEPDGTGIGVSR